MKAEFLISRENVKAIAEMQPGYAELDVVAKLQRWAIRTLDEDFILTRFKETLEHLKVVMCDLCEGRGDSDFEDLLNTAGLLNEMRRNNPSILKQALEE